MQKKESVPEKTLLESDGMHIPSIIENTQTEDSKSTELKVPSKVRWIFVIFRLSQNRLNHFCYRNQSNMLGTKLKLTWLSKYLKDSSFPTKWKCLSEKKKLTWSSKIWKKIRLYFLWLWCLISPSWSRNPLTKFYLQSSKSGLQIWISFSLWNMAS